MRRYSEEVLDEMSAERIWTELGLHRGEVGARPGCTFYAIGSPRALGVLLSRGLRIVLDNGDQARFTADLETLASKPWQPIDRHNGDAAEKFLLEVVKPAQRYLNSKLEGRPRATKPIIKRRRLVLPIRNRRAIK